jgi:DNA repair protein RadC
MDQFAWRRMERPRERLREVGAGALSNRELLTLLVGSGTSGRPAADIAAALLQAAGGSLRQLAAVLAKGERIDGVGPATAGRISASLELGRRLVREGPLERERIGSPADVHARCGPALRDLVQEEFRLLLLNTQHAILREITVTRGTVDGSLIHAREVFRPAIAESATSVILVHNHPSGDPTPSPDDHRVTLQLVEAGRILGIPVLDHVIIGDGRYTSFVETGILARRF